MHDLFAGYRPDEKENAYGRFIFFSGTIGGDVVGWDPLDLTNKEGPEYRVYFIARLGIARPVSASFREFISQICLANNLNKICGWKEPPDAENWPPQEFLPYRPMKTGKRSGKK